MTRPLEFKTISAIDPDIPASWQDKVFLTFDIDWASDAVLNHTLDLVEAAGVCSTWFITHPTPFLDRLLANKQVEVGLHPNLNHFFEVPNPKAATLEETLDSLHNLAPKARVVRSHSLVQSSRLSACFERMGFTHECNTFVPVSSGVSLKPWRQSHKPIQVPHGWEDDVAVTDHPQITPDAYLDQVARQQGLAVLDFHPIHVALNTEDLARYERARPAHQDWTALQDHRFEGYGTASWLTDLIRLTTKQPALTGSGGGR
ncbi:MAG: hypothetical protein KC476_07945 [Cyanobacteria bacterium HKST-UBA06]|nr:hypothetical protein [Cyanobacteria bacterium HKST-UBA06]